VLLNFSHKNYLCYRIQNFRICFFLFP